MDLMAARRFVSCPILRKDFIIDEYQLYETKALGADVVLLIAAALTVEKTLELARKAHELGLEVLLEVHNAEEIGHANDYVDMLGVNNRNLKTFEVSLDTTLALREQVPADRLVITESGITTLQDVQKMQAAQVNAFLVGEAFMRAEDPGLALHELFGAQAA